MHDYIIAYLSVFVVMIALDGIWLGLIAKGLYRRALGPLMADKPNFAPAALFYLIYPAGVVIFAVAPAIAREQPSSALIFGLLFGFFNFATYDLTNWSIVRDWPSSPLAFDLPWGTAATGIVAFVAYLVTTHI